jgi:hypothetical protein
MQDTDQQVGQAPAADAPGLSAVDRPSEQSIYEEMWKRPEYRVVAPGEDVAQLFASIARPPKGATLVDLGCGTGRGGLALAVFAELNVTMVDFASNSLDEDILPILEAQPHAIRFVQADLTKSVPVKAEYGYCTDVMEHIPPADVDAVLNNCLMAAEHVFFQISTVDDVCGALIGHPLHLSVHPYEWWLKKFRDRECIVHWSASSENACMFYVSAWQDVKELVKVGTLNVPEELVRENVRKNIARGFAQAQPHETNDFDVILLGGGPSLNKHVEEIRALREDGAKLVCLNGSHDWALEHGLKPSAQIVVDARAFNARFTRRPQPECRYMIASQCDPSVFDGIPPEQVLLWHTTAETVRDVLDEQYTDKEAWWGIPGGSTVLLRAIPLMRMLGFRRFHLFGCDSCLSEDEAHHAYAQPENDEPFVMPVTCAGRVFHCHPWMASQAEEFQQLIRVLGNEFELAVHGDGLLRHILVSAAEAGDAMDSSAQEVGTAG